MEDNDNYGQILPQPVTSRSSARNLVRSFSRSLVKKIPSYEAIRKTVSSIFKRVRGVALRASASVFPIQAKGSKPEDPPTCIKAGTLLMECKPFAAVTTEETRLTHCSFCYVYRSDMPEIGRCGRCYSVKYCDDHCLRLDWEEGHKFECKGLRLLRNTKNNDLRISTCARMMIRVLTKLQDKDKSHEEKISADANRTFQQLISHVEELKNVPGLLEIIGNIREAVLELVAGVKGIQIPDGDEFIDLYGKISINAFAINDADYIQLGSGLYLGASVFNHSCNPTAIATFESTKIMIRNMVDLPLNFPIELVTLHYKDPIKPTARRKAELRNQYFFECECDRCSGNVDDAAMVSVGCEFCHKQLILGVDRKCPHCSKRPSSRFQRQVKKLDDCAKRLITASEKGSVPNKFKLELVIQNMLKLRYSRAHWLLMKMCNYASDVNMAGERFAKALAFTKLELVGLRRHLHPSHGLLGYNLLKASRLAWYLRMKNVARTYLIEAEPALRITYGTSSTAYHNLVKCVVDDLMKKSPGHGISDDDASSTEISNYVAVYQQPRGKKTSESETSRGDSFEDDQTSNESDGRAMASTEVTEESEEGQTASEESDEDQTTGDESGPEGTDDQQSGDESSDEDQNYENTSDEDQSHEQPAGSTEYETDSSRGGSQDSSDEDSDQD